jgi:hypothetical protein
MELKAETIVVVARQFNPTILNQHWLIANAIVREGELDLGESVFSPPFVQFCSAEFEFQAIPDRIQLSIKGAASDKHELVKRLMVGVVSRLPETPYSAIGINFLWRYGPLSAPSAIQKRLFFNPTTPLADVFNTPDARYGAYYSMEAIGFRMKLTAVPMRTGNPDEPATAEFLDLNFNFHKDVSSHVEILSLLEKWSEAKSKSEEIAVKIETAR